MKGFLLVMALTCMGQVAFAQTSVLPEVNLDRYNKLRKQEQLAPLVEKRYQQQLPQGFPVTMNQPNKVQLPLAYVNALGEVYVLPQDNMPMLKPFVNGANPMPGTVVQTEESNTPIAGKMPNAIPVQPFSFQPKNQPRK